MRQSRLQNILSFAALAVVTSQCSGGGGGGTEVADTGRSTGPGNDYDVVQPVDMTLALADPIRVNSGILTASYQVPGSSLVPVDPFNTSEPYLPTLFSLSLSRISWPGMTAVQLNQVFSHIVALQDDLFGPTGRFKLRYNNLLNLPRDLHFAVGTSQDFGAVNYVTIGYQADASGLNEGYPYFVKLWYNVGGGMYASWTEMRFVPDLENPGKSLMKIYNATPTGVGEYSVLVAYTRTAENWVRVETGLTQPVAGSPNNYIYHMFYDQPTSLYFVSGAALWGGAENLVPELPTGAHRNPPHYQPGFNETTSLSTIEMFLSTTYTTYLGGGFGLQSSIKNGDTVQYAAISPDWITAAKDPIANEIPRQALFSNTGDYSYYKYGVDFLVRLLRDSGVHTGCASNGDHFDIYDNQEPPQLVHDLLPPNICSTNTAVADAAVAYALVEKCKVTDSISLNMNISTSGTRSVNLCAKLAEYALLANPQYIELLQGKRYLKYTGLQPSQNQVVSLSQLVSNILSGSAPSSAFQSLQTQAENLNFPDISNLNFDQSLNLDAFLKTVDENFFRGAQTLY